MKMYNHLLHQYRQANILTASNIKNMFYATMLLILGVLTSISTANAGALDGLIVQSYKINDAGIQKNNGIDEYDFQYYFKFRCYEKRVKNDNHQNLPWFMILEHYSAADQWLGFVQGSSMESIEANFANTKSVAKIIQLNNSLAAQMELDSRCKTYTNKLSWGKEPNTIYPYPDSRTPKAYYFGRVACFKDIAKASCNNKIDYIKDGKNRFRYDMKLQLNDYNADEYQLIRVLEQHNGNQTGNTTTLAALFEQFSAQHSISFLDSWPDDPSLSSDNLTYIQQHLAEYKTQNPTTETIDYAVYETTKNKDSAGKNWKISVAAGLVELPLENEAIERIEAQSSTRINEPEVLTEKRINTQLAPLETPQARSEAANDSGLSKGQSNITPPNSRFALFKNLNPILQIFMVILCLVLISSIAFAGYKFFSTSRQKPNKESNYREGKLALDNVESRSNIAVSTVAVSAQSEQHQINLKDKAKYRPIENEQPNEATIAANDLIFDKIIEAIDNLTNLINENKNEVITQQKVTKLKTTIENTNKTISALVNERELLEKTIESLQATVEDNQQQNKMMRDVILKQNNELDDVKSQQEKAQHEADKRLAQTNKEQHKLQLQLKELQLETDEQTLMFEQLKERFDETKAALEAQISTSQTISQAMQQQISHALAPLSTFNDFEDTDNLNNWKTALSLCCQYLFHNPALNVMSDIENELQEFYTASITILSLHGIKLVLPLQSANTNTAAGAYVHGATINEVCHYYNIKDSNNEQLQTVLLKNAAWTMLQLSQLDIPTKIRDQLNEIHHIEQLHSFIEQALTQQDISAVTRLKQITLQTSHGDTIGEMQYENI